MTARTAQRGFTMLEIVIGATLLAGGLLVVGSLLGSTKGLTDDTQAQARASKEHRRNLIALEQALRNADPSTLEGFDDGGVATDLSFQRVLGADLESRTYDDAERLEWRAATGTVPEVERPGDVWLVRGGTAEIVARNVPEGGFRVRQEGSTLAIELTTYYVTSAPKTARVTGETALSLRN